MPLLKGMVKREHAPAMGPRDVARDRKAEPRAAFVLVARAVQPEQSVDPFYQRRFDELTCAALGRPYEFSI